MALRKRDETRPWPIRVLRFSGQEVWEAAGVDQGQELLCSDGLREELLDKSHGTRHVTSAGTILYLFNLELPAVTTAADLVDLEERVVFASLNSTTQPDSPEKKWLGYAQIAALIVAVLLLFLVWSANGTASKAQAVSAANATQLQHITSVLDALDKRVTK